MLLVAGSRRDLHEWATGSAEFRVGRAERVDDLGRLHSSEAELLFVLSDDEPALPLPPVLVVRDGAEREILAWAATYVPLKPLTAFCRLISRRDLAILEPRVVGGITKGFALGLVGAVFAEAGMPSQGHERRADPSMPVAMGTYSFFAARALVSHVLQDAGAALRDRWLTLQRILGARHLVSSAMLQFWTRVGDARRVAEPMQLFPKEPSDVITRAIHEVMQTGIISPGVWRRLTDADVVDMESRTLEERVRAFQQFGALARGRSVSDEPLALALAYLANQILPGGFEHSGVLRDVGRNSVASLLWYGFIAGLTPGSRVGTLFDGLGWRLYRELLREEAPIDRTKADIALDELSMLHEHAAMRASIHPSLPPYLRVEMLPCVYSVVIWNPQQLQRYTDMAATDPVTELGFALARATDAYREIARQPKRDDLNAREQVKTQSDRKRKPREP